MNQTQTSEPIISHEVIIHGSAEVVVVPIKFSIYARKTPIENRIHRIMSEAHDFDWFIIGELDKDDPDYLTVPLGTLRGTFWTGHIQGMDDYYPLLDAVRGAVFNGLAILFPLAVFPDQDD